VVILEDNMIAVSPTDHDWFLQLREAPLQDRVNFWTPTPWNIRQLNPGDTFYFLLKSPIRKIGGYGTFAEYTNLSAVEAWDAFGLANGVRTLADLVARTARYAERNSQTFSLSDNPTIGCIILSNPIFFDDEAFLSLEEVGLSFPPEVVKVKYFDREPIHLPHTAPAAQAPLPGWTPFTLVDSTDKAYKKARVGDRPGQAKFRQAVLEAYDFQCAISGETCREVLEAAHIQPYIDSRSDDIRNGLALRIDLHRLFDAGLLTIGADYRVQVSEYVTSPQYREYAGKLLRLPEMAEKLPAVEALEFHRRFVYRVALRMM
jgi:putative restriction endonuclease